MATIAARVVLFFFAIASSFAIVSAESLACTVASRGLGLFLLL